MEEISNGDARAEQVSVSTKYRPSSELDFKRYAKCAAELLECPLQEAQELLARAYGYEHLHELQQVLKTPGVAGPFEDRMYSQGVQNPREAIEVRVRRHDRLGRAYLAWCRQHPQRQEESDDMLLWDLGLFSSPKKQKVAANQVKEFREVRTGFSADGFPYGFTGILHSRYQAGLPLDESAFEKAQTEVPFTSAFILHPDRQLEVLRERRSSELFIEMVRQAAPELAEAKPEVTLSWDWFPLDEKQYPELLQPNFDEMLADILCERYEPENHELDEPELERLLQALAEPSADNIARSRLCSQVSDLAACLPRWRLSLRLQLAKAREAGQFYDECSDYTGPVKLVEACSEGHVMHVLLRKVSTWVDITRWELHAVLMRENDAGRWEPAGALFGDYILPSNEETNTFQSPSDVVMYFDDMGDRSLLRAWLMLQSLYLPRTGYASYGEWVNDSDGGALANVLPWVAPRHRGTATSQHMFDLLGQAFEDVSWDSYWMTWFGSQDEEVEPDYVGGYMSGIGPMFISLPGTGLLGFSIWEGDAEAPTVRLLREGGHRLGGARSLRRYPGRFPEAPKRGLGNRLLEVLKPLPGDFILYDSEESAADLG